MNFSLPNFGRTKVASRLYVEVVSRMMSSSALAIFDQCVVSGTRFLTSIIVARSCGVEDLAVFSLAFVALVYAGCIHEALITKPYTVFYHRQDRSGKSQLAGSTIVHTLLLGLVCALGFAIAAFAFSNIKGKEQVARVLYALALALPCSLLWEYARKHAFAQLKIGIAVALDTSVCFLQISTLLLLSNASIQSVSRVYVVIGLACLISSIGWWLGNRHAISIKFCRIRSDAVYHWQFGKWMLLSQTTHVMHGFGVPWILLYYSTKTDVGVFTACERIVLLANPMILGLGSLAAPRAANALVSSGIRGMTQAINTLAMQLTFLTTVFIVVLLVVGDTLITRLYGAGFSGQGNIIAIIGLCALAWGIIAAYANGLLVLERTDTVFYCSLMGLITLLISSFLLIPQMNLVGGAISLLLGNIATSGLLVFRFYQSVSQLNQSSSERRSQQEIGIQ